MKYKNFITIEGGEGTGKTSIMQELEYRFKHKTFLVNKNVLFTREPGKTDHKFLSEIRKLIMNYDILPTTELFLFQANRFEHVNRLISPQLKKNGVVICDRFTDSTFVYQGMKGISPTDIKVTNSIATVAIEPGLTFIIDLDINLAQQRISQNKHREVNKFDTYQKKFHQEVRNKYLSLARSDKKRYIIIDGNRPLITIVDEITNIIEKRLG